MPQPYRARSAKKSCSGNGGSPSLELRYDGILAIIDIFASAPYGPTNIAFRRRKATFLAAVFAHVEHGIILRRFHDDGKNTVQRKAYCV